jgi:hypothetical protein
MLLYIMGLDILKGGEKPEEQMGGIAAKGGLEGSVLGGRRRRRSSRRKAKKSRKSRRKSRKSRGKRSRRR